jgi:iron complex outermembrane receptor protein
MGTLPEAYSSVKLGSAGERINGFPVKKLKNEHRVIILTKKKSMKKKFYEEMGVLHQIPHRKLLRVIILSTFIIICNSIYLSANAQKAIVTGKLTNMSGEPVIGASILEKGTANGVTSDIDGNYKITVSSTSAVLVYSFLGFLTEEKAVDNQTVIDLVMVEDIKSLKEVVVTALGIKREAKSLGYAITSIKGEEITKAGNTVNPLTTLYGKAAGVGVSVGSAGPTGGVNIKIRGSAGLSIDAKTRPLFVVDGVPIYDENTSMAERGYDPLNSFDYGTGINDINADDIESIEILKGAKATVLYGSKAGSGVIMINTKKGQKTRGLGVNISYQTMTEKPVSYIDWQNEYGSGASVYDTVYATYNGLPMRKLNNSRLQFGPKFDGKPIMDYDSLVRPYNPYPNNWIDLFQTTVTKITTAAIQGANENGAMRLAFTNKDYKGSIKNFYQKDNTVSFSGQIKASKLATFEVNANLHKVKTQNRYPNIQRLVSYGFNRDIDYKRLEYLYKDELGQKRNLEDYGLPTSVSDATGYMSMLWDQNENKDTDDKLHFTGSVKFNLQFLPYLALTGNAGTDYTDIDYTTENAVQRITPSVVGGKYAYGKRRMVVENYNTFLNFNKKLIEDKLDIIVFAGPEITRSRENSVNVQTMGGLQYPGWYSLDASQTVSGSSNNFRNQGAGDRLSYSTYSLLGSASIGWENTYYLEFSARNDWTSLLPPKNNSYFYPGISATWNFSESYKIPKLTYGKLRVSWADVGRPAPRPYYAYPSYTVGRVPNTLATTILGPESLFAGDLKNERLREYEFGFDTRWFEKTPLEVDFSYYVGNTYDQIMDMNIGTSSGWSKARINIGDVKKWGYELFIKYTPIKTSKLRWDVSFNTANQYSKVVKLYPGINKYSITSNNSGSYSIMAIEGQPIGDVQMFDYLRDPDGNKVVTNAGTYTWDSKKLVTAANINPRFIGGFQTDFFYRNFSFGAGFDYKFGGKYLSYSNYYLLGNGQIKESLKYRDEANGGLAYYKDASNNKVLWQHNSAAPSGSVDGIVYHDGIILSGVKQITDADGNVTGYAKNDKIIDAVTYYGQYIHDMSEWFQPDNLYKNDYIKLREISIMYTFPKSLVEKIKLQKLSISFIARNLFYLYKTLPNVDPESALGANDFVEYSPYPQMRQFGFKVDMSF